MGNKLREIFKWFYPGIGIKRWIVLGAFGVFLMVFGSSRLKTEEYKIVELLDWVVLGCGIMILILAIKRMLRSFIAAFIPSSPRGDALVDIFFHRRQLNRGPKVVAIGGGTGLSVLLTGLKEYTSNISAIVTVADDGGSSGRLRKEFDILPPGDIRNCLVALADAPALMRELFQFRFDSPSELAGHSFGNLFITVMTRLTGDFEKAIKETSKVLALKGRVIPSTLSNVTLVAQHKDGSLTEGENNIPKAHRAISKVFLRPSQPQATLDAIKAIEEAQVIVLGPGSLYTSIIPNLLIKDICDAIVACQATKVYVCNIMTQPGETDDYNASSHIKTLISHSHPRIFDYCLVNSAEIPVSVIKRYREEGSFPVVNDRKTVEGMGYRVIDDEFAFIDNGVIRHDAVKLAKIILGIMEI